MADIPAARGALHILTHLARQSGPVAASAIARDLGLPRSSTYQLIRVMQDEGYVVHYPELRAYGLGSLVSEIGSSVLRATRLGRLAQPLLDRLVADVGRPGGEAGSGSPAVAPIGGAPAPQVGVTAAAQAGGSVVARAGGPVVGQPGGLVPTQLGVAVPVPTQAGVPVPTQVGGPGAAPADGQVPTRAGDPESAQADGPVFARLGVPAVAQRGNPAAQLGVPTIAHLGIQVTPRLGVPAVAQLGVLHGSDVSYVSKAAGHRAPTTVASVGVRLPAHLTATGRSMLAALPAGQVRALFPHRDSLVTRRGLGPTTLRALDEILASTRDRGFAVEDGEITQGYSSVAATATDRNGYPVAAIGLTFLAVAAPSPEDTARLGAAVVAAAGALTARLGGR